MSSNRHRHASTVTLDQLFEVVSRRPRRQVLDALREESPRGVDELAHSTLRSERDPESVRIALRHSHLPRLDETGVVRWSERSETVRRGPQFDQIQPFLELMADHQDRLPVSWP